MNVKEVFQAFGLVLCIIGMLWIVISPQYKVTSETVETTTGTETTVTSRVDMPYAFVLLTIGALTEIMSCFLPSKLQLTVSEKREA